MRQFDFDNPGDDEYIVRWNIRDIQRIHAIQDWFGQSRYVTLNGWSIFRIKKDDPRFPKFQEGAEKRLYYIRTPRKMV